jgi:hypothetical protein
MPILHDFLEGKEPAEFKEEPYYSPEEDSITIFFADHEAFADVVNKSVTLYRSLKTTAVVGVKIHGIRRLLNSQE